MDNGLVLRVERLKPEDLGDHDIDYDFDGQFRHDLDEKTIRSRFLRTLGPLHDILRIEGGVVIGMSLPWDAEVLGVPTYRVLSIAGLPAHLTESILDDLMVERSMELGCCRARVGSLLHARLLDLTGWHLISTKVMFRKVLDERAARAESQKSWRSFQELSTRHRRKAIVQMWGLWEKRMPANRFTRDPRLGAEKARAVYREWITHATEDKGQMVWIWLEEAGDVDGFLIAKDLGLVGNRRAAAIELVAVRHGSALGEQVVLAAESVLSRDGFKLMYANTESRNNAGLRLFERCGYASYNSCDEFHHWTRLARAGA